MLGLARLVAAKGFITSSSEHIATIVVAVAKLRLRISTVMTESSDLVPFTEAMKTGSIADVASSTVVGSLSSWWRLTRRHRRGPIPIGCCRCCCTL